MEDRATADRQAGEDGQLLGADDRQDGCQSVLQGSLRIRDGAIGCAQPGASPACRRRLPRDCIHYAADIDWEISTETYVEALNREVRGLRDKTEVWCHTCWGNPLAQRIESSYSYKPVLPYLDRLDVDVITFETADNSGAELPEIAAAVGRDKKICIGVVSHRTLQVEQPDEVAALIRNALRYIEPERLVLSSDCGFGRQGMSRLHAFYKMIAIVEGANIVREELGLPKVAIPAADPRYSLVR